MDFYSKKMVNRYEQIQGYSEQEFERRWNAVRTMMKQQDVGVLLVIEGYWEGETQWLLGLENTRRCDYVVIPEEGELTAVFGRKLAHAGEDIALEPWRMPWNGGYDPVHPNIRCVSKLDVSLLKAAAGVSRRVGIHNYGYMSAELKEALLEEIPGVELVDLSGQLHFLSAVKSEEELEYLREGDKLNEKLLYAAVTMLRPGNTVQSVAKEMMHLAAELGSDTFQVHECLFCEGMDGEEPRFPEGSGSYPGNVIRTGERYMVISETNGIGGMHTAIGRPFMVGQEPCEETKKLWQAFLKAQDNACRLMKTGARLQDVYNENYRFINAMGYVTNVQQYIHGIGYCYAERPYLHDRNDCGTSFMPLVPNISVICHPIIIQEYAAGGARSSAFGVDTVLTGDDGARITNHFPREIMIS